MNLPPPNGWVVYIGADGTDVIPDNNGYFWWADNIYVQGRKDETWRAAVLRTKGISTEIIELPEVVNGAITLSWSPFGLYAASSYNGITKVFRVNQFAQFTANVPVAHLPTIEQTDSIARQIASQALQEAQRATEKLKTIDRTLSMLASSISSLSTSMRDVAWSLIHERLGQLIESFARNDRSDKLNARWQDVLFQKTKDWIYIWMKENKKL